MTPAVLSPPACSAATNAGIMVFVTAAIALHSTRGGTFEARVEAYSSDADDPDGQRVFVS